ncbi:unnamed protein product [Meloidogyne enterolobii]|uniref:Uncharacterized protein n=1 Tax=Meloidogyne enterolobii TaxID=390850 RepID=A0ACB0YET8_MELEN
MSPFSTKVHLFIFFSYIVLSFLFGLSNLNHSSQKFFLKSFCSSGTIFLPSFFLPFLTVLCHIFYARIIFDFPLPF